jgi:hypothetical protein
MLMAAKIEQPVTPSVKRMIALLPPNEQKRTSKQDICLLEKKILFAFDFDLYYVGPIHFLERYQRLLEIDQESMNSDFKQIGFTARQFCKYMTRVASFNDILPSQQAAAALILALNINLSQIKEKIGLKPLQLTN